MASDVCRALNLRSDHTSKIYHIFKDDEIMVIRKGVTLSDGVTLPKVHQGSEYKLRILSESGLYKLIMRSDKKEAVSFQDWVTREVLPTIRKTGSYSLADAGREAMPLPMDLAEALAAAMKPPLVTQGVRGRALESAAVG